MRLVTEGLKGCDRDLSLGRQTLIIGPNGAGKSTIADALRFLALGHVPALGKRLEDVGILMRGSRLRVRLELSDGRIIERRLDRKDDGFTASAECSWLRNARPGEHAAAARALFGREATDAAEALDVRTLLAATASKRAARVEELLQAGGPAPRDLAEAIARWTAIRLSGVQNADKIGDWRQLLTVMEPGIVETLRGVAGMLEAKVLEGGIASAQKWANEEKRRATKAHDSKKKAIEEIKERVGELAPVDPEKLQSFKAERDRLQQQLGAAREREEAAEEKERAVSRLRQEQEEAAKKIEAAREELSRLPDPADLEKLLAVHEQDREKLTEAYKKAGRLSEKVKALEEAAENVHIPDEPQVEQLRIKTDTITRALSGPWEEVYNYAEKIRKATRSKAVHQLADKLSSLARREAGHVWTEAALKAAKEELANAIAEEAVRNKALRARDRHLEEARKLRDQAASTQEDLSRRIEVLGDKCLAIRSDIDGHKGAKAEAERKLEAAEAWYDRLKQQATPPEGKAVQTRESFRKERETLEADIARLDEEISEIEQMIATQRELLAWSSEMAQSSVRRDVFSAIEWAAKRVREAEVTRAGSALTDRVRTFLRSAGRSEVPYFEAERGTCDIGWTRDGRRISVEAMSGGEWALFTAALSAAILQLRKAELRILLVEAGETDDATLGQLLAGAAAAEDLTTIVMTPTPPAEAEGWTIVDLGKEDPVAA